MPANVFKPEDALPVVLHANDDPTVLLCLVVELLDKGAHFRVRETLDCSVSLSGARDEFHLAAIVQNLKTLALRLVRPPPGRLAI